MNVKEKVLNATVMKYVKMNILSLMCVAVMAMTGFVRCSGEEEGVKISSLKMDQAELSMEIGKTFQLGVTTRPENVEVVLKWASSNENVATVSDAGLVKGVNYGTTLITARFGSYTARCTVTISEKIAMEGPLDASAALAAKMNANIIYSKNVLLYANKRIMQGFDIVSNGNIYYSQVGSPAYMLNVCKASGANQAATSECMIFQRFGHGTQIVAEETSDNKVYIWLNSNASVDSSGEYGDNWSFSRVEFKAGTYAGDGYGGDTFFLNKDVQFDQQVSIDFDNRRLLVGSRKSGVRYFWVFDLDEVLALPLKEMSATVTIGGSGEPIAQQSVTRKVQARDLNDCRVLGNFSFPAGSNKETDVYSYSHQGHEVYGNYVYFYEGNAVEQTTADTFVSKAYMTVFDYTGKIVVPRTEVAAISDVEGLKTHGLTTTGYAEAESFKLKGDKMYLGVACRDGSSSNRRANIFVYDCVRD